MDVYIITLDQTRHNYGGAYRCVLAVFDNYGVAHQYCERYAVAHNYNATAAEGSPLGWEWRKYSRDGLPLECIRLRIKELNEEPEALPKWTPATMAAAHAFQFRTDIF